MKWKKYNQLTPDQKEEYDFRFKKNHQLSGQVYYIVLIWALVAVSSSVSLVILKEYVEVSYPLIDLLTVAGQWVLIMGYAWGAELICKLIFIIIKIVQEERWVKKALAK